MDKNYDNFYEILQTSCNNIGESLKVMCFQYVNKPYISIPSCRCLIYIFYCYITLIRNYIIHRCKCYPVNEVEDSDGVSSGTLISSLINLIVFSKFSSKYVVYL